MKAKELMIGDWVRCNTKLHGECVCRVTDIEGCHNAIWVNNGKVYGRAYENEIEPIPLTADILEANDIHRQWGMPWYQGGYGDEVFELALADKCRVCIHYVHELQHALQLCGIEKDIKYD